MLATTKKRWAIDPKNGKGDVIITIISSSHSIIIMIYDTFARQRIAESMWVESRSTWRASLAPSQYLGSDSNISSFYINITRLMCSGRGILS